MIGTEKDLDRYGMILEWKKRVDLMIVLGFNFLTAREITSSPLFYFLYLAHYF